VLSEQLKEPVSFNAGSDIRLFFDARSIAPHESYNSIFDVASIAREIRNRWTSLGLAALR
jgi:hypothetical protein